MQARGVEYSAVRLADSARVRRESPAVDAETLGTRLKAARNTAGMTRKDAADRVGVANSTLQAIENGAHAANVLTVRRLIALYRQHDHSLSADSVFGFRRGA